MYIIKIVKYFFQAIFIYLFFIAIKIIGINLGRKYFSFIFNVIGPLIKSEQIINKSGLNYVIFRFFNLTGADEDGEFGEDHQPETHLIPRLIYSLGDKKYERSNIEFELNGDDYNTKDGTCIRDYVHVNDVADAHILASEYLNKGGKSDVFNLGTGKGHSVYEILSEVEKVSEKLITIKLNPRRDGDAVSLVADISKAVEILKYEPKYDITSIIKTAYEWHSNEKQETTEI